nr:MAG TPA: hypothetical protein [Caudoviricetes sp.]
MVCREVKRRRRRELPMLSSHYSVPMMRQPLRL